MKFIGDFTNAMKEYAKEKLTKIEKYVNIDDATVSFKKFSKEDKVKVEISLDKIRASKIGDDYYDLIYKVIDKLDSQIKKYKEKSNVKIGLNNFLYDPLCEDESYLDTISKEKILFPDEITSKKAIDEMELLDHDFYIYKDIDKQNDVCVLYKRYDDTYGIIDIK